MTLALRPAHASRQRCVVAVAQLLASRHRLTETSTAVLLTSVRRRFVSGMSAARNVAITRKTARDLASTEACFRLWLRRDPPEAP